MFEFMNETAYSITWDYQWFTSLLLSLQVSSPLIHEDARITDISHSNIFSQEWTYKRVHFQNFLENLKEWSIIFNKEFSERTRSIFWPTRNFETIYNESVF